MNHIFHLLVLLLFSGIVHAQSYHEYQNDRFGYSIKYPSFLVPQGVPANNDGLSFKNKSAELLVWGDYEIESFDQAYQDALNDMSKFTITYHQKNTGEFTISGFNNTLVVYRKTIYNCRTYISVILYYPKSQLRRWNPIVKVIAKSLRFNSTTCDEKI
jgi:hypothetical protein